MKLPHIILFVLFFTFCQLNLYSQGCSDAGFCTIDYLSGDDETDNETPKNKIKIGISNGKADFNIKVNSAYLEYAYAITPKLSVSGKLASLIQDGAHAKSSGLSDIYLNANYALNNNFNVTGGVKLPLNKADKTENNLPLPMSYQTSLGTTDIILGVGYKLNNLNIILAAQQPVIQNKNEFLTSDYSANSPFAVFQSTNEYQRKGDVLLRALYNIKVGEKLMIIPGILPIYHIANDEYVNTVGNTIEIEGSQGLTLNGNLFLEYSINKSNSVELSFGTPFITRKARPDGLTREYVIGFDYQILF